MENIVKMKVWKECEGEEAWIQLAPDEEVMEWRYYKKRRIYSPAEQLTYFQEVPEQRIYLKLNEIAFIFMNLYYVHRH